MTLSSLRNGGLLLAAALVCSACGPKPVAGNLSIAAAADLQFVMPELIGGFQVSHPAIHAQAVYGSSGNFYAQIQNGAPFDLFLSADLEYPRQLAQEGLALQESLFTYATGTLVLWVPANSPLDVSRMGIATLEDASVKHIAIANPQHAPYGRAAESALRHLGVYERVAAKLVIAENIAQALQFVQSGAADAGLVSLSLVAAPALRDRGRYWQVPQDAYTRLWQGGAILSRARDSRAATAFRAYLSSPEGKRILQQYGFTIPTN